MKTNQPTTPGWYWALWIKAAEGTGDPAECANGRDWEIVEVWENYLGAACEADEVHAPKFAVSVTGVEKSQWLDCFKWGKRILSSLDIERIAAELRDIREVARERDGIGMITLRDRMTRIETILKGE